MDATPRRWLLKPLSPVLQLSDLRTISTGPTQNESSLDHLGFSAALSGSSQQNSRSPEEVFQARHIGVNAMDGVNSSYEWPPGSPSSPSNSSSGSQTGFYSFVEDPTSPEAELNEAWMVSPQRHAQLATLKMEKGFKLQTYANYRKPQSLFSESNGDSQYLVDLNHGVRALQEEDEKHLRKEIIRNQAPKKNLRLTEGSGVTSRTQQLGPAAAPSTINMESINFKAARQQFLRFEQGQATSFLGQVSFCTTYMNVPQPRGNDENVGQTEEHLSQQTSVVDGLGSHMEGLSVEAAYGSSSKREASDGSLTPNCETPIEREIRLTQQREENLRRSRGLKISTSEIVEIKTKRLQSPQTPTKAQGLPQGIQHLQGNMQEQHDPDPEDARRKDAQNAEDHGSGEIPQSGDTTDFFSPCCPHRHTEETEFYIRTSDSPSIPEVQDTRSFHPDLSASSSDISSATIQTMDTPWSWRETMQMNGLQSRKAGAPSVIEQEIEEVLKREEELRELRESSSPQVISPAPLVNQATTHVQPTTSAVSGQNIISSPSLRPTKRTSSISFLTAQPWTPTSLPTSATVTGVRPAPPPVGGLTDTLLQDFEERRAQQKLEENSYAGILRLDHINHEVVESTRVTRHKNQRAVLWEAGVFANQADQ